MPSNQPDFFKVSCPVIVHPQLRWNAIWGRPQQILSRVSRRYPVLYVEPPLFEESLESRYETRVVRNCPDVTIVQMYFPVSRCNVSMWIEAEQRRLLRLAMRLPLQNKFENGVRWFLDPMSFNIFNSPADRGVIVYDCLCEAAQMRGASYQTAMREPELLARASLVFAGSRALQREKSRFADNCHFVGSGVDAAHFGAALDAQTPVPHDTAHLAGAPLLGYFGTIDERLDFELLAKIADENPTWTIAMIGPIARVEEYEMPQRDNILWLGAREYSQLPAYAKCFDACLLPFVQNETTQCLNPTQTLEYMAAGKPILATALPELQSAFAGALYLASSHDDFLAQSRQAISHPDSAMIESGVARAGNNSWEAAALQIEHRLAETILQNQAARSCARLPIRPMSTARNAFAQ